jgi:Zn-dependent protease
LLRAEGGKMRSYLVKAAGVYFERDEVRGLVIATLALIVSFTWPTLLKLPIAVLVAILAFAPHELAHKIVAFTYGYAAKFKASLLGILIMMLISFITQGNFTTGYAGYVEIQAKRIEKDRLANIALAGPLTNILTGLLLAAINDILMPTLLLPAMLYLRMGSVVCISIGIFNLLPIGMLDGQKVFSYSKRLWIASVILGVIVFCTVILI